MEQNEWSNEDPEVSDADCDEILKNILDYDELEADHFASLKKPSAGKAPAKKKPFGIEKPKNYSALSASDVEPEEREEIPTTANKPNSASGSTAKKKVTFTDDEDLGQISRAKDYLQDEPLSKVSKDAPEGNVQESRGGISTLSPSDSPVLKTKTSESRRKRNPLLFDDDHTDDLLDALGFDTNNNNSKKKEPATWLNNDRSGPQQRVRTRVDDILENLNSPRPLAQPQPGEKDPPVEHKQKEKTTAGKESVLQEDLAFGSYQPSLGPKLRGQQPSRPSLRSERFSTEGLNFDFPEKKPKPTSSSRGRRASDWLGLKSDDDFLAADATSTKTPAESLLEGRPSPANTHIPSAVATEASAPTDELINGTKQEASKTQLKEEDKDDWLAGVLRRKALTESPLVERRPPSTVQGGSAPAAEHGPAQTDDTAEEVQPEASESQHEEQEDDWLAAALRRKARFKAEDSGLRQEPGLEATVSKEAISATPRGQRDSLLSVKESNFPERPGHSIFPTDEKGTVQADPQLNRGKTSATAVQQQTVQLQSHRALTEPAGLQRVRGRQQQPGDDQALQARIIQLEGQVKSLELAQEQSNMLLENVQMKHKQDMELTENTHKTKIKWLEESAAQRETLARQECEDLKGRLSEQQAEFQRKLDRAKQDRNQEVEQLRDVHRNSISELRKEHEDQIQHLKRLKNDEINVVKSATSQTRSLTAVTEQMEQFSSQLGELCSFSVMQDRLAEQQKAAVEERAFLKDIISRMHTQLREQERQLEKERWKATAEEAKVESVQRDLEEERRSLSKEREELERAKSALLEEQASAMECRAAERRRLDAEWAGFHNAEKQRQEQVEKEASSLLEKRESAIISLTNEQAELKLHMAELKQRENAVAQERESLERLREELESSKKKIRNMESRLSTQMQEVEALRKLTVQRYEKGEHALQEAKRVEAEHEAQLADIHRQRERLWKREEYLLQEHMRISRAQKATEQWRPDPPAPSAPRLDPCILPDLSSSLPNPVGPPSTSNVDQQSMYYDTFVALWRYTAQKDQEQLQEEEIYLQNLKMLPHSGH